MIKKKSFEFLNNNIYLSGITMLLLNIGSKYITIDISPSQQQFLKHTFVRRLVLFSIFYMGTKEIILSLGLTAIFIVLSNSILNADSKYCLLSKNMKQTEVSNDEYKAAQDTVQKYESQNEKPIDKHHDDLKNNYYKIKEELLKI